MDLMDTVSMMNSPDYKERFKAEYYQLKIRYDKLHKMCIRYEAGTLNFTPTCSLELLKEQKAHMGNYLRCLEIRAEIEGIELQLRRIHTMFEIIMETVIQIIATLLLTLIGVLGTWLTIKISKKAELANIAAATNEATRAAQTTVLELQQTTVAAMKAAHEDGKLTEDEIKNLSAMLLEKALDKMSEPAKALLMAAGVDISAIITGAGEAMIGAMKK
jgi:hypothetical protein